MNLTLQFLYVWNCHLKLPFTGLLHYFELYSETYFLIFAPIVFHISIMHLCQLFFRNMVFAWKRKKKYPEFLSFLPLWHILVVTQFQSFKILIFENFSFESGMKFSTAFPKIYFEKWQDLNIFNQKKVLTTRLWRVCRTLLFSYILYFFLRFYCVFFLF